MRIRLLHILCFLSISLQALAQKGYQKDLELAEVFYQKGVYQEALKYYENAYSRNSNYAVIRKIGACHQHLKNFEDAYEWYVMAANSSKRTPNDTYNCALALKNQGKYGKACELFRRYLNENVSEKMKLIATSQLASCDSALKTFSVNNNLIITNLADLNTAYAESSPCFYQNGIVFCSNRENVIIKKKDGFNGLPYYNLYVSVPVNQNPKKFSTSINSWGHEGPACFNSDFNEIYFTKVIKKTGDDQQKSTQLNLFRSSKGMVNWTDAEKFILNDSLYSFGHPNLSSNGEIFIFASDMPGGYGGTDIYISYRIDSANWALPINAGPIVNSASDEISPFFHEDGLLIYSSNRPEGLGGYDIYTVEMINGEWKNLKNAGLPINSPRDDSSYIVDKDKKTGYLTSDREGGLGNEDIYEVKSTSNSLF